MMTLSYNTRAHKIAIVVDGGEAGYFEMACPHVSGGRSSQRREREHGRREWGQRRRGGARWPRAQVKKLQIGEVPHRACLVREKVWIRLL
jgi:hypothetical protein